MVYGDNTGGDMVGVLTFILVLLNNSCHTLEIVVDFLISPLTPNWSGHLPSCNSWSGPAETDCPGAASISSYSRTEECFSIVQSRQASSKDIGVADEEAAEEAIVGETE